VWLREFRLVAAFTGGLTPKRGELQLMTSKFVENSLAR